MRHRVTVAVLIALGLVAGTLSFAAAQGPQPPGLAALVGWVRDGGVVRLFQSGDTVGIGTTAPTAKLHVVGNVRIDGDVDCPGCVHTADLADSAVTSPKIADGGVATSDLADGAVTTAKVAANAIDGWKIADGSIRAADVNAAEVQVRVTGSCALGSSIRAIDSAGGVTCETDDNSTYAAGAGLALSGTQFSVKFGGTGSATTAARSDHAHELADGSVTRAKIGADVNAILNDLNDQNTVLQARVSALETLLFTPWRPQTSGTGNLLISVAAVDANTAWAVGSSGTILKTTNGGATWVTQVAGTTAELYGVVAADANTAWVVGELVGGSGSDYLVLNTTNGGATWGLRIIDRSLASGGTRALRAVAAADRNTLWAVGDCGTIFKTTDGGATWVPQHQLCGYGFGSIAAVDTNTVWAAGGYILKTANGGATWTRQYESSQPLYGGISAANAATAWSAGETGTILKTTDGGATWVAQSSGTTRRVNRVLAVDSNTAWAVGPAGMMLKTMNGGATWTAQASGTTNELLSISAAGSNVAWAVGQAGTILKTTSGGVALVSP